MVSYFINGTNLLVIIQNFLGIPNAAGWQSKEWAVAGKCSRWNVVDGARVQPFWAWRMSMTAIPCWHVPVPWDQPWDLVSLHQQLLSSKSSKWHGLMVETWQAGEAFLLWCWAEQQKTDWMSVASMLSSLSLFGKECFSTHWGFRYLSCHACHSVVCAKWNRVRASSSTTRGNSSN